jgi:hypothetical protein
MIMHRVLILTISILFSLIICGQGTNVDTKLSSKDSIFLNDFWTNFRTSVKTRDKAKLEAICEFPFYCEPCIDDTTLQHNDHVTIRVTKRIFTESQYKLFFDGPISDEVNKHESFDANMFIKVIDNNNKPNGFKFSYTIVAPSNKWEGLQGFIFLGRKNSEYKITGIDTVP